MLLYGRPLSSDARKMKSALRAKGLDFQVETPAGSARNDIRFTWPLG